MADVKLWWRAIRPFAFPASLVPLILGSVIAPALHPELTFRWGLFFLVLLAGILVHAGTNLVNDYFDFKRGVDREGTLGSSGVLVEGLMTPEEIIRGAGVAFLLAFLLGIVIVFSVQHSFFVFLLALLGLLSGIFYTAAPVNLKYLALGDLQVFLSMGLLMTYGAYFVQAEQFSLRPLFYAVPVGFLVDAILHGNNLRDIESDSRVQLSTLAILLGDTRSRKFYRFLIYGAYFTVPVLILFFRAPLLILLTLLTFNQARRLVDRVMSEKGEGALVNVDVESARLHLAFGLLYSLAFLIHSWIF